MAEETKKPQISQGTENFNNERKTAHFPNEEEIQFKLHNSNNNNGNKNHEHGNVQPRMENSKLT